jgi:hypothetical protein
MLLYELFNDLKFECLSDDGFAHSKFRMIVTINNQNFDGTGKCAKVDDGWRSAPYLGSWGVEKSSSMLTIYFIEVLGRFFE